VIKRAYLGGDHLVVEKDGIPVVVILSFPDYERLIRQVKLASFERLSLAAGLEVEREGLTEEELEAEIDRSSGRPGRGWPEVRPPKGRP
jgi:hypothetical protein